MRTLFRTIMVLFVTLAITFGGQSHASTVGTTPATSGTPFQQESDPFDLKLKRERYLLATKQEAFDYFISPQRGERLQYVLDTVGMHYARQLLKKRIPSATRADKFHPAPVNGYGMLYSVPDKGNARKPYVEVMVKFVGGKVDLSAGVFSLFIIKNDVIYSLNGAYVQDNAGRLITDTAMSYVWKVSFPKMHTDSVVVYRDKAGIPSWSVPLVANEAYEIMRRDTTGVSDLLATVAELREDDNWLINTMSELRLNG